ncbi:hypothetical protein [Rheinheimera sp.]|uniref:hypothetical protein n=1 Tax=Rheinheimera sp. TaxID=1869214 RepID=UPI003D2834E0
MNTTNLYDDNFPQAHKVQDVDIITLYHARRFEELDAVVICKDREGIVAATFGQSIWHCLPFSREKERNNLNFSEFNADPQLQRQLKVFTFGWIFNKSPKQRKALKFSTIFSQFTAMKKIFRFLMKENESSLAALSSSKLWLSFQSHIQTQTLSQSSIVKIYISINAVVHDSAWHKIPLGLQLIKSSQESEKLSNRESQQTLVIPERLCHKIYGRAIDLIETAMPYAQMIADTEQALQANYLEGKRILYEKLQQGRTFTFIKEDGSIAPYKYSSCIIDNQPQNPSALIAPLATKLPDISLNKSSEFHRYLGQLINACYIVCGGFSGMRRSELNKLTPNSYYKDTLNGRVFHMLQSHTFKLGEKRETWITAESSKTAIDLMTILTKQWRDEATYPNKKYTNTLWLMQKNRSKPPQLITQWYWRLHSFCEQHGFVVTEEDFQECMESNPRSAESIRKYVIVGKPWNLSSHQFRRSLAFYCVKNRLSTLVALKQQFKHLYLAMTDWYTNGGKLASLRGLKVDPSITKALDEINAETTTNKIFKQWHSDGKLSGAHGKAIIKMRGDVPTIYSSWDVIFKAVKDGKLTLHGTGHSYCKNGYDCDMDGVVMPQFCVDCSGSIIDEQQAKWWQKKHGTLVAYMASGNDISVTERSHYITQVRAAEKVMCDFDMAFTPFEPELIFMEV